ncbi:MAG: hypothetical protein Q8M95_13270 [Candidatus Methanoperedens sp.]|nr:hypothetical protein [Candidatus Methanoperedens sp.]
MSFELIDSVSFLLFTIILYFLSVLSKRFGEVMGIRKYYYLYYAGMLFTSFGSLLMSLSVTDIENSRLLGYAFFSVGLTLGLLASIRYWGWLIKEIIKG